MPNMTFGNDKCRLSTLNCHAVDQDSAKWQWQFVWCRRSLTHELLSCFSYWRAILMWELCLSVWVCLSVRPTLVFCRNDCKYIVSFLPASKALILVFLSQNAFTKFQRPLPEQKISSKSVHSSLSYILFIQRNRHKRHSHNFVGGGKKLNLVAYII